MTKRFIFAAALAGAAAIGGLWLSGQRAPMTALVSPAMAQEASASSEAAMVPDMVLGQADAPVEVVEYASFTCPHCANFHDTVFEELKKNYVEPGKVRFVYREVYFDKYGLWAGLVARCGGPEKYFAISDMIFDTQGQWLKAETEGEIADNLRKIGLKAGLEPERLDACMKDGDMAKAMVATYQENAKRDEIEATPSFMVNGKKYSNMSYEEFAKLLDEELAN